MAALDKLTRHKLNTDLKKSMMGHKVTNKNMAPFTTL